MVENETVGLMVLDSGTYCSPQTIIIIIIIQGFLNQLQPKAETVDRSVHNTDSGAIKRRGFKLTVLTRTLGWQSTDDVHSGCDGAVLIVVCPSSDGHLLYFQCCVT